MQQKKEKTKPQNNYGDKSEQNAVRSNTENA